SVPSVDPLRTWIGLPGPNGTSIDTTDDPDNGTVSVKVTATDTGHLSVASTFGLTVTPVNDAPTAANPIADQSAEADLPFSFVVPGNTFADPDAADTLTKSGSGARGNPVT